MRIRNGQRGQAEVGAALGCMGLASVAFIVIVIVVGGTWRTEVSLSFPSNGKGRSQTFEEKLSASHWLLGLAQGEQPDVQGALAKFMRPEDELTQLTVVTRHSFVDMLVTGVTLTIYCPVTVTLKGTFVTPPTPATPAP